VCHPQRRQPYSHANSYCDSYRYSHCNCNGDSYSGGDSNGNGNTDGDRCA
jgi:hypothetical protein